MEIKKRRPLRSALFLKIKYLNILLFGNFLSSTGFAEHSKTLVESFDASAGINNLLFAGIERVALRADFDIDIVTCSRADLEFVAAGATYVDFLVLRMNILLHLDLNACRRFSRTSAEYHTPIDRKYREILY